MSILIEAENATVAISHGRIVEASGKFSAHIKIRGGEVRPGLINGHDHLHRNHYGRLGSPPYANAVHWAMHVQRSCASRIELGRKLPRQQALQIGAWKNLLAGVTHVMHHDQWEAEFERDFPLTVIRIANSDSLGMTPDFPYPPGDAGGPERSALHVSEGVDADAAEEIRTLSSRRALQPGFLAVHAVGPDSDGIRTLRASGCAIVWCPTSNHFLFGRTAPDALLAPGMDVILGTDSLLTGEGDILDELQFARGRIDDERLVAAVGSAAARRLGIPEPSLTQGACADLVVLRRPLLEASFADVALVMAAGKLRVLDPALLPQFTLAHGSIVTWRGAKRWISGQLPNTYCAMMPIV